MSGLLQGGIGRSAMTTKNAHAFALLGGSLNVYDKGDHFAYLSPLIRAGYLLYSRSGTSKLEMSAESLQYNSARFSLSLSHNFVLGKNHALRLEGIVEELDGLKDEHANIAYRFHF
jgi:hypothetical protein